MEIVGYIAGGLTALTMLPQIYKSIQTKQVGDLSLYMLLIYVANASLWVTYGLSIHAAPLVIADSLALTAGVTQLVLRLRYAQPIS